MKVILVIGMPGSGKTFAAKLLAKKLKANRISSGDAIRSEIKRRGLRYTSENDRKIANYFHQKGREKILVKQTIKKIKKNRLNIIEGFRNLEQLDMLRKNKYKPIIIYIYAPFSIRAKRQLKRKRFILQTLKYLRKRDRRELGLGLGKLIKKADYVVSNRGSKQKLEKKLVELVKSINL